MPRGRGRGRGRPPTRRKVESTREAAADASVGEESPNEVSADEASKGDQVEVNDSTRPSTSTPGRKRGRKRKSEIITGSRVSPETDPAKRGIVVQSGGTSLRRRETLKSTSRYSPPPPITSRRSTLVNKTPPQKIMIEDNDMTKIEGTNNNKRKSLGARIPSKPREESASVPVVDDSVKGEEPPAKRVALEKEGGSSPQKKEVEKPKEEARSPRVNRRKSSDVAANSSASDATKASEPASQSAASTSTIKQAISVSATGQLTLATASKTPVTASTSRVNSTPGILTKSMNNLIAPSLKNPVRKSLQTYSSLTNSNTTSTGTSNTKYMDSLPEINDCILSDGIDDSKMEKLPDRILLVTSELPLPLAVNVEKEDQNYLFRQIISPVSTNRYVCLLCKGIDVNFGTKEEKDILLHYESLHELQVETAQAKFSEEIVFICLPKMILTQFNSHNSLQLNTPCQYCDLRLVDINEMKEHYSSVHSKEVVMMEQEEIMRMHHFFYCCKCKFQSADFDSHHKHMKTEHKLRTYRCRSCVLVTQDANRIRAHYKAKHMLHHSGQNYQCYYCHGLLIGVERLQKHIQQSHMVQTCPTDFSCVACRQSCGRGKDLLTHAQNCTFAGVKQNKSEVRCVPIFPDESELKEGEVECFFCSVRLESNDAYQLHLHHEHMKWVSPAQGSEEEAELPKTPLTIKDVISDDDLERAQIKTYVGHWCKLCDQMVKVYQLFYLHMVNYHKQIKVFQCVISSCKLQFKDFEEFKKHVTESGHSQKTIISHPDQIFVCTYCDIYFATDEELTEHLITDQHINKFTSSGHFHRTEPRNFKCKACHTYFGMKEAYIHHLETESHQYVCTYCGITTATPSSRRAHIQNTHPEKLMNCEDCNETSNDIMAHFVVHGYTFECKQCVKKFYNRERLNAHMEVHQDPIECTWEGCDRMIATRSMLVTHYRGHKSEHKCNICGQAFWNLAMLTSHQRSHQPMPRTPQQQSRMQARPVLSAATTRSAPHVLQRTSRLIANTPMLANSAIRCSNCSSLFRSAKELNVHKCSSKVSSLNNGEQNKLLELAARATAQSKTPNRAPARRRTSPKKSAPSSDMQIYDLQSLPNDPVPADDDTQVIMILNQSTGELMEITAPKGMEVQDVINSLNLNQGTLEEGLQVETVEPQPEQEAVTVEANKESVDKEIETPTETGEMAADLAPKEEVVDGDTEAIATEGVTVHHVEPGTSGTESIVADGEESSMVIGGEEAAQIIAETDQGGQIVLPATCLNEDGTLTLDEATLSRLNLAISMDDNTITTDGNTTYIIDTSS